MISDPVGPPHPLAEVKWLSVAESYGIQVQTISPPLSEVCPVVGGFGLGAHSGKGGSRVAAFCEI
jgi:hypothetical protein